MSRPFTLASLALLAALAAGPVAAWAQSGRGEREPPAAPTVLGEWSTEDGHGVIAIEPCGEDLCGRIVGIQRTPGEPMPKDVHGAPQCGLVIIRKEHPDGDGSWLGEITDPRDGTVYGAKIWIGRDGNLRLRGFLGLPLLGQTQVWRRFTGRIGEACGFA